MSKHIEAQISGDNGRLSIQFLGRENDQAESPDDRNWLSSRLSVDAGPFSGSIRFALMSAELEVLHQRLAEAAETLRGEVSFTNMEDDWTFGIHFERTGEVVVRGVVAANRTGKNSVSYEFGTDPASLEGFIHSLASAKAEFPTVCA